MKLTINQQTYEIPDDQSDRRLVWVLRDHLGLTGTKFGCGMGICGSCVVHIDGKATRSCITTVSSVEGKAITTIEGLAETAPDGTIILHPVQEAFMEKQAPQCGWCQSGQMMTAAALLEDNPQPEEGDILRVMNGVYCRCGTYPRIKQAVMRAIEINAGGSSS